MNVLQMSVLRTASPAWKTDAHALFEEAAAAVFKRELAPHVKGWREQGKVDRRAWWKSGGGRFLTTAHVKERKAFGGAVMDFQNTQFKRADRKAKVTLARVFVDYCTEQLVRGRLDAKTASMSKMLLTDLENQIVDECLQLFGGYGDMDEYPISRLYADSCVRRIYGGTNEIMNVLIARKL